MQQIATGNFNQRPICDKIARARPAEYPTDGKQTGQRKGIDANQSIMQLARFGPLSMAQPYDARFYR